MKCVSGKDGSVGKGVVEGAIDTVASIGLVDGAIVGASIAGPWGEVAGFITGAVIQSVQLWKPILVDGIRNNKITKSVEQGINDCGKAVKKGIDKAGDWISEKGNQLKRTAEKLINSPKLSIPNWF